MKPKVSIVIVNFNGIPFVLDCLRSVFMTTYENYEVILVDNASSDNSLQAIQNEFRDRTNLVVIDSKANLSYSGGNNLGISRSDGKYIMILNNDTIVEPNWLDGIVDHMEVNDDIAIAQCKLRFMDDPSKLDTTGSYYSKLGFLVITGDGIPDKYCSSLPRDVFSVKGAAMLIRRESLNVIGTFDSDFRALNEEADLCWRSWLCGYRVIFFPDSVVYHKGGATITKNFGSNGYSDLMLNEGSRNYIRMNFKNLGRLNLPLLIPHVLAWSLVALYLITRKEARKARLISNGIFISFGQDLRGTLRKRQIIQNTRKISDTELFSRLVAPYPLSEVKRRFRVVARQPAAG